ncbi:hypothetical protein RHECNPAF_1700053 [Rhizobium etli CNPAF512]|nr:hypothetical protein RHECNPAF_1700053 [Rhizobium etli CNPAF512]
MPSPRPVIASSGRSANCSEFCSRREGLARLPPEVLGSVNRSLRP